LERLRHVHTVLDAIVAETPGHEARIEQATVTVAEGAAGADGE
jgi:hypothetical protein